MRALALLLVACNAPPPAVLPGASITPHFVERTASPACGLDVMWSGSTTPDVRFLFLYDEHGRMAHASGVYAAGYGSEEADYTWDNLDHMMRLVQTHYDHSQTEIVANYNTLGDLIEYTWNSPREHERYLYSHFSETGRPLQQLVDSGGTATRVELEYDAQSRITRATPERGPATLYSYDDETRTTTIDSGGGLSHGVVVYDERNRPLSETWDGSAPSIVATQQRYTYEADLLLTMEYRAGTHEAPHELHSLELDTYRYDCRASR